MTELNSAIEEPVRGQVTAVLERARSDQQYAERLRSQPHEVLTEAGIDPDAAGEFSDEIRAQSGEVVGHMICNWTCDRYSCWISLCGDIPFSN